MSARKAGPVQKDKIKKKQPSRTYKMKSKANPADTAEYKSEISEPHFDISNENQGKCNR